MTHDPSHPRPRRSSGHPGYPDTHRDLGDTRSTADLTPPGDRPSRAWLRARGTPRDDLAPEQLRTLIFARESTRATWIEHELSRAQITITIQVARKVRTVVSALLRDPPPRPEVLIVDFDAVSAGELLELHAIRHEGWTGRLIGLGVAPPELRASLGVDHLLPDPLVRDSLLDCVAGTGHAAETVPIPIGDLVVDPEPSGRPR